MDEPDHPDVAPACAEDRSTGELEELAEPLVDSDDARTPALAPGTTLCPDDEDPVTVIRLLRDEFPLRLYEARHDEEPLWLWERAGESASLLMNEGAVLRQVHSPMFPRIQASFSADGRCYLATESCSGETLGALLSAGKLEAPRAVSVLTQVAFALTKLHDAGFVHLGLRPETIVPGRPTKILGFSDVTPVGQPPGRRFYHAGYSAPELLREGPVDVRSDIYAVGALLFHAMSGKPIAESGVELTAWEPEAPVAGVPQILSRCLGEKDTRYGSAAELHRDLLRLVKRRTPPVRYVLGAATSIGLEPSRTTNQDAFTYCVGSLVCEEETHRWLLACVADGMGGMEAGEEASRAAVRSIEAQALMAFSSQSLLSQEAQTVALKKWAQEANDRVISALEKRGAKGGSTLLCACLIGNRLAIAHVGDCRLYLIRGGEARLLTRDHSLGMALVGQGEIDLADLRTRPERSQVTRSLGERRPMPDYYVDTLEQVTGKPAMELEVGDTLLLCSDGVWEPLVEEELVSFVVRHESDLNSCADAIVNEALTRGGVDNATALLVRLT